MKLTLCRVLLWVEKSASFTCITHCWGLSGKNWGWPITASRYKFTKCFLGEKHFLLGETYPNFPPPDKTQHCVSIKPLHNFCLYLSCLKPSEFQIMYMAQFYLLGDFSRACFPVFVENGRNLIAYLHQTYKRPTDCCWWLFLNKSQVWFMPQLHIFLHWTS